MMNSKNFSTLKIILVVTAVAMVTYGLMYSNKNIYFKAATYAVVAVINLFNGMDEIKKPKSKKFNAYLSFGLSILFVVFAILQLL